MTGTPARAAPLRQALLFSALCLPLWAWGGVFTIAHPVVTLALMLGVTLLFLRRDGRSPAALGLELRWRRAGELLAGFAGGAALVGAMALLVWALLPFPWARHPGFDPVVAMFSLTWLLTGNAVEELIFRGYSFERLIAALGIWKAQLATALLFALFHIAHGWPWTTALLATTAGSLLFGFVFIRWRSVPAAAGVHAAANWVRDLLLLDPPRATTMFAPLAPRPWTAGEQMTALTIFTGATVVACLALWWPIRHRRVLERQ